MRYFDKEGIEIDRDTWGALFEKHDYRRIDHTMLDNGMSISTVWLGMQGGFGIEPYLFETMAFAPGSYEDMDVQRYHTMKEAQHGHQEMVNKWRERNPNDYFEGNDDEPEDEGTQISAA